MDRIREKIKRREQHIEMAREAGKDIQKIEQATATLTTGEMNLYQTAKGQAQASGIISFEEAQTIYFILENWAEATLAERISVTEVIGELLKVDKDTS